MSTHYVSNHYAATHQESSHFGRLRIPPVHPPGTRSGEALHRRILLEDELILQVIMAFLNIKDHE